MPVERRHGRKLNRCVVPTVLRAILIRCLVRVASVFAMPPWMTTPPPRLSLIAAKALPVVILRLRVLQARENRKDALDLRRGCLNTPTLCASGRIRIPCPRAGAPLQGRVVGGAPRVPAT